MIIFGVMNIVLKIVGGILLLIGFILPIYVAAKSPERSKSDSFVVFVITDALCMALVYMLFLYEDSPLADL